MNKLNELTLTTKITSTKAVEKYYNAFLNNSPISIQDKQYMITNIEPVIKITLKPV